MCWPVGLKPKCDCKETWMGWVPCQDPSCPVADLARDTIPPVPDIKYQPPTLEAQSAWSFYCDYMLQKRLFLPLEICCGPKCCQDALTARDTGRQIVDLEYFREVKRHWEICVPAFNKKLGMLNGMRLEVGNHARHANAPENINANLLPAKPAISRQHLDEYKQLLGPSPGPNSGLHSCDRDPVQQYLAIRRENFYRPKTIAKEPTSVTMGAWEKIVNHGPGPNSQQAAMAGVPPNPTKLYEKIKALPRELFTQKRQIAPTQAYIHQAGTGVVPQHGHGPQFTAGVTASSSGSSGYPSASGAGTGKDYASIIHRLEDIARKASKSAQMSTKTGSGNSDPMESYGSNYAGRQANVEPLRQELEAVSLNIGRQTWSEKELEQLSKQVSATRTAIEATSRQQAQAKAGSSPAENHSRSVSPSGETAFNKAMQAQKRIMAGIQDLPNLPNKDSNIGESITMIKARHAKASALLTEVQPAFLATDRSSMSSSQVAELLENFQDASKKLNEVRKVCMQYSEVALKHARHVRDAADDFERYINTNDEEIFLLNYNPPNDQGQSRSSSRSSSGKERPRKRHAGDQPRSRNTSPGGGQAGGMVDLPTRTASPLSYPGNVVNVTDTSGPRGGSTGSGDKGKGRSGDSHSSRDGRA